MKITKQRMTRIFLVVECLIFTGLYLIGSNGMLSLATTQSEIFYLTQEIDTLKQDIETLQSQIALQQKHPFFKEKIAREQLQMARENEEIYLL